MTLPEYHILKQREIMLCRKGFPFLNTPIHIKLYQWQHNENWSDIFRRGCFLQHHWYF